jgi:polyphosphate glucokinase
MNVLVIDIGGTKVKMLATGEEAPRKFESGPTMAPKDLVMQAKKLANGWIYEAISIGYPGVVHHNRIVSEPHNLARGWVGFDFEAVFGQPVKIMNDAAMQALGSYRGGKMLFLGLGTGLGSSFIVDGIVQPMELGHLPYRHATYEDYVGQRGRERLGNKEWRDSVKDVVERLVAALQPDEVVLGGGNVKHLKTLPERCRAGENANAFIGGFRLWEQEQTAKETPKARSKSTGLTL